MAVPVYGDKEEMPLYRFYQTAHTGKLFQVFYRARRRTKDLGDHVTLCNGMTIHFFITDDKNGVIYYITKEN